MTRTSTSPATAVPLSVAQVQAIAGPDSSQVAAAAVKESLPATVRKGKRKRAAPAYLYDGARSTGVVRNAAVSAKRTPVSKTKTLTKGKGRSKGKGKGKVVPKLSGKAKKKAAVFMAPIVSSAEEVIAAPAPAGDVGGAQETHAPACALEGSGNAIDAPVCVGEGDGDDIGAPASDDKGGGDTMDAPASAGRGGGEVMDAAGEGGGQALPVHDSKGIVLLPEVKRAIDYYNIEMNRIRQLNQHMIATGVADWVG